MTDSNLDRRTFLKSLIALPGLAVGSQVIPAALDRALVQDGPHLELVIRLAGELEARSVFYDLRNVTHRTTRGRVVTDCDDATFSALPPGKVVQIWLDALPPAFRGRRHALLQDPVFTDGGDLTVCWGADGVYQVE